MPDRIGTIRRGFLIPADDLNLEFLKAGYYGLGDDMALTLSLLYGIGPNAPRLLAVDDAGRLLLGTSGVTNLMTVTDDPVQSGAKARVLGIGGDGVSALVGLWTGGTAFIFNGSTQDRIRAASAANLAAQSGFGVSLSSPPGMWSVVSTPAAGAQATATKAAGAAGVRHICTGIIITVGAIAAPVATALTWVLRDGASGAGTIIAAGQVAVPAAVFQGAPIVVSDIAIPGSAATAMTLEFSAALANLLEGVTLTGFDAA